jgi:hypothetical protein
MFRRERTEKVIVVRAMAFYRGWDFQEEKAA